jgi:ACS family glucarate transporter-like MFS transporter
VLIAWMFVIAATAYLDRTNIQIGVPSIEGEFHLNHKQMGWVLSAFVFGYALFQAPGGRMADRFGPRKILTLGAVWWAVFTSLTAFVPAGFTRALLLLIAVRFLLGVGEAVVFPASNRLVASWIPSQERGLANGLIFAGVGAGAGVSSPLIGYIIRHNGWHWSFWMSALIGLAAGTVWFLMARDRPEEHPWVDSAELAHIRSGLLGWSKSLTEKPLSWRTILSSKNVWIVTISYSCFGYVAYIFFTWFFTYLSSVRGLNPKASSYYTMLPPLAMVVCSLLGGFLGDRWSKRFGKRLGRCGVAGAGIALAGIFIAIGPLAQDVRLASLVLAGGAGALYLSQSAFWSVSSDIGGRSAGSVSGVMNMGNQLAGALTALLMPFIADHYGWDVPFFIAAAVCAVGSLAWLMVDPERELAEAPTARSAGPSQ